MSTPSPSAKLKARDTGRAVEKLRDEKEGLVGDVSDLNQRMSEMASEENMLRTRLFRAEERIDELKTTLQQHVIEMERMSSQLSVRTSEGTDLRLQLGDAKSALNLAQESLREKSEKLNGFETQNNKAHLVSRLEKEKKYLEETLTSLNNELSSARKDKFQISLQYDELLNNEVRTLRADCDSLSSTVESLTDELTEMRGRSLMLEAECSQIQDELTSERARANSLQRQCEDATSRYSQTSADLTKAMSTVVQLQSVVRHLQSDEEITSTTYTSQSYLHSGASPGSPGAQSDASVAALISPNGRGKTAEINYLKKQLADERGLSEKLTNELRSLQAESIALRQQQQVATSRLHTLESEHRSQSKVS